ncbi:glycosyltransferase [Utexia brackfieldae]|uniref:glycosyltransferase n=1 Tax=Utexia brackfieldae TaxID=3074108 RepID=UPI00370D67FF
MFFERQLVIKETYHIGNKGTNGAFNVAYGVDKNFLLGSMISMASLLMNNSSTHFSFHLFTDYFNEDYQAKLKQLSAQYHCDISVYLVDCDELKKLPSTKNWSYAMYFRFLALDFIHIDEDRVLYLDADVVCKNSVQKLVDLVLDNYTAAVVKDGDSNFWFERSKTFEVPEISNGYFNSGVMLVNLKNWLKSHITERAMKMLSNPETQAKLVFPDQDVLNILLCKDILFLDNHYNTQTSINFELQCKNNQKYPHPIIDETVFIHYIGPTKPWHIWAKYPVSDYFYLAKKHSPWQDSPLIGALSTSSLRYQAKHQIHQGKYLHGIWRYLKYFCAKLR